MTYHEPRVRLRAGSSAVADDSSPAHTHKPIAKTDSCQAAHFGYFLSGRMKVVMNDGTEEEFGPGDVMVAPPGHDAWTLGDEACVVIDWHGVADYAKRG